MLRIKNNSEFYGKDETFVFMLEPFQKKFGSTLMNTDFIYSCKDYFLMGSEKYFKHLKNSLFII